EQAGQAVNLLNKTMFDDRVVRVDFDAGISEGRQFGRGESGDQWRDDFRGDFDVARGGQGRNLLRDIVGMPEAQVYVGKRKQDHGRFGVAESEESAKKRAKTQEGSPGFAGLPARNPFGDNFAGLPMTFGSQANAFGGYQFGGAYEKGPREKGKGLGKGPLLRKRLSAGAVGKGRKRQPTVFEALSEQYLDIQFNLLRGDIVILVPIKGGGFTSPPCPILLSAPEVAAGVGV
ncbi:unnamed protein product, partial [Polarella glacialis]